MKRIASLAVAAIVTLALGACQLSPKTATQNGYRGTGMDQIQLTKVAMAKDEVPAPPYDPPATDGQRAKEVYQNVQVLGDESADQFNYTMAAITQWVSPEQGCNYCHNPENMASDELYTKVVARRMLQMTRNINRNWKQHVAATGVTCWTCHRGNAIPANYWTMPAAGKSGIIGNRHGQNDPVPESAFSSLPNASLALYITGDPKVDQNIRVQTTGLHPGSGNKTSTMSTENSYAIMMHTSQALGVNCTFCHNSQSFQDWSISTPQRAKAWYGIRMVRETNGQYITPLATVFPAKRKGTEGDPFKVNCTTCHQGKNKPMGGAQMAKDYHALWGETTPAVMAAPAAPAAAPAGGAPAR
ncbi:photosynthetic reaction center cytochrome PufC [Novosphingobium piscinae]|uniref:Photosynthetic reaction center cytochrome c subunit n=1 Tax=Novosphingobium piscinae TaxID=1507448 RepID=A0A7X1FY51_9SPHN|nr:photosynthetic reaction center cytochrome PufC [Novosphingobium piscinae]MBC2668512.1 photosynthetic reaction center cytochrome c subunit [Novosphingobium piscinae]